MFAFVFDAGLFRFTARPQMSALFQFPPTIARGTGKTHRLARVEPVFYFRFAGAARPRTPEACPYGRAFWGMYERREPMFAFAYDAGLLRDTARPQRSARDQSPPTSAYVGPFAYHNPSA